ncbi:hypothetical protein HDU83_001281 [Entophlyctis luteolus]|nr:hypothetical protein HDU83_001281 [Entophlyctis luteolus]
MGAKLGPCPRSNFPCRNNPRVKAKGSLRDQLQMMLMETKNTTFVTNRIGLDVFTVDDGMYLGDNEIPYITAPSYRVFGQLKRKLANDATLFTQVSLNRFHLIPQLIRAWDASLSISIYVESLDDLPVLARKLRSISVPQTGTANGRTIRLNLLFGVEFLVLLARNTPGQRSQTFQNRHHPYDLLYPINALRNLALMESRTDLVVSLDADFVPSKNAHANLVRDANVMDRLYDFRRPTAVVFAAFEEVRPESISSSGNGLPRNKRNLKKFGYDALSLNTLRQACAEVSITPFHFKVNLSLLEKQKNSAELLRWCAGETKFPPRGLFITAVQGHTNFTRWFSATEPYEIRTMAAIFSVTTNISTNANIPRAFDSTQYANYDANNAAVGDAKFQSQERPVINMFYGTDLYPSFHI